MKTEIPAELATVRPILRSPAHPGELMREILDEHLQLPTTDAAQRMRIAASSLEAVLAGAQPVTAELALRFARLTGGNPELYVQMQVQYDLWVARQRLRQTLAEIEPAS
ncbi:MAG: HigA family addiction module antitoxin [Alphaproteobacteria bacterium]